MIKALALLALLALGACSVRKADNSEFFVTDAPGRNSSFLVERHSGCVWALVLVGDKRPLPKSTSFEDLDKLIAEDKQVLEDSKIHGTFELVDVKSEKADWCRKAFGMTRALVDKKA